MRRTRLLRLLDEAVAAPVTLVVAPAGVGKTVLVSSWTAQSDVPTSWLTLDKTDRDGRELWPGMVAALEVLRPGCGEGALTVLRRSGPLSAVVHHLLEDLDAGAGTPGVLVVDDLHLVDDQEALDSLALFLQHLPTWLHVVLLSRRELALPVARLHWRARTCPERARCRASRRRGWPGPVLSAPDAGAGMVPGASAGNTGA